MPPLLDLLRTRPARVELCALPSPLESHPALARRLGVDAVLIKRDDLNGAAHGGNKLRGLEWLLPGCGPAIVTMGGYGSTWCAALATAAAVRGQRCYPALFPQPWSSDVAGMLSTTLRRAEVSIAGSRSALPYAVARAWLRARRTGPVSWLPAGGATPLAALGGVNAALEFADQVHELGIERPDAIVVPFGSGATAAGLLVGLWICGWEAEVCAVRVTDPWFASRRRLIRLAGRIIRLLKTFGLPVSPGPARVRVLGQHLGDGYGHPTAEARHARNTMAEIGVALDLTYSAKAWAALSSLAGSFRRITFWHTFDQRLLSPPLEEHPLFRQARAHSDSSWPHLKST